ncbi:beta-N-acetylhexosaminidase [Pedobacter immunditicola]|uniref:beta-N-acetylhexosaminidase n=1 Tax=Pedobacter immunditicola TaxID=3133440 RepID=UPI00309E0B00
MSKFLFSVLFLVSSLIISLAGNAQDNMASTSSSNKPQAAAGLLPIPQQVELSGQSYVLDESWSIKAIADNPAVKSLESELQERFHLILKDKGSPNGSIKLLVKPGSIKIENATDTNRTALANQAYQLTLNKNEISILANADQGLFYGVQTLLQLLQSDNGKVFFATGKIVDWPNLDLRMIYWDNAHHLERIDAMKRAIKQASYYKINAITIKLEGHFQFPSAKPIVEPYAYTPAEFQDLTDYAKSHYVELVPYIDAPAHVAFILKHPEYAGLRAFSNSNYQFSVVNPKTDELLLNMFNDLFDANKGGNYVMLSTDEAYYLGKAADDKKLAKKLGGNGKLFADFVTRIGNKLHEKDRKVMVWAEYPLRPQDINTLPSHIINGVYNKQWAPKFKANGMRQLVYTSTQGEEPLFPNYHKHLFKKSLNGDGTLALTDDEKQQGNRNIGRVEEVSEGITSAISDGSADLMGVVVAAWADAGLHPETFWLGYATGTAVAWNHHTVNHQDLSNRFYTSFYGSKAVNMDKVYQLLSTQAEFWDKSWDWVTSTHRSPIFGDSEKVFETPQPVKDQVLPALPLPSGTDLSLNEDWALKNKVRLTHAENFLKANNELMNLLNDNLSLVGRQNYNLQVLFSVAQICRQNLNLMLDLQNATALIKNASDVAKQNPTLAVSLIDQALRQVKKIHEERNLLLQSVSSVWFQDWYPLVAEANGRKYLHQVDDVKDHEPVRTIDLSYLIYRQLKYPVGKWVTELSNARNQFAKANNLPVSNESLNWENTKL